MHICAKGWLLRSCGVRSLKVERLEILQRKITVYYLLFACLRSLALLGLLAVRKSVVLLTWTSLLGFTSHHSCQNPQKKTPYFRGQGWLFLVYLVLVFFFLYTYLIYLKIKNCLNKESCLQKLTLSLKMIKYQQKYL